MPGSHVPELQSGFSNHDLATGISANVTQASRGLAVAAIWDLCSLAGEIAMFLQEDVAAL